MNKDILKYTTEFIATFIFFSIILFEPSAIPIAIGICAMIYFAGKISGAHLNPCVSLMEYLNGNINRTELIKYCSVHILSAYCAYKFYNLKIKN